MKGGATVNQLGKTKLSFFEALLVSMMIAFPLDLFNIKVFGFGVSAGRALLLVAGCLLVFRGLLRKALRLDFVLTLGLLSIFSTFISLLSSSDLDEQLTRFFLPSYLIGQVAFCISYLAFRTFPNVRNRFPLVLSSWTLLIALFSFHGIYCLYVIGIVPLESFLNEQAAWIAQSKRLFLPTATPPHLSLLAGILFVWWLWCFFTTEQRKNLLAAFLMLAICFLTFSRSGLFACFCALIVGVFAVVRFKVFRVNRGVLTFLLCLGVTVATYPIIEESIQARLGSTTSQRLHRFETAQGSIENHIRYRMQAFELFEQSTLLEKTFGIGVGNYERIEEGSTYSFSIYLTALAEQGIFGCVIMLSIFGSPLLLGFKRFRKARGSELAKAVLFFTLASLLFIANFFYEFKVFAPMWVVVAWLHACLAVPVSNSASVGFNAGAQSRLRGQGAPAGVSQDMAKVSRTSL